MHALLAVMRLPVYDASPAYPVRSPPMPNASTAMGILTHQRPEDARPLGLCCTLARLEHQSEHRSTHEARDDRGEASIHTHSSMELDSHAARTHRSGRSDREPANARRTGVGSAGRRRGRRVSRTRGVQRRVAWGEGQTSARARGGGRDGKACGTEGRDVDADEGVCDRGCGRVAAGGGRVDRDVWLAGGAEVGVVECDGGGDL